MTSAPRPIEPAGPEGAETTFDFAGKYESQSPIARFLVDRFYVGVAELLRGIQPRRILEVGCGEGFSTLRLRELLPVGAHFEACDVERRLVEAARRRNPTVSIDERSIYALGLPEGAFDLVVCMEVLEHLERPAEALAALAATTSAHLLLTVPREPLWRGLNLARLKYVGALGNTPGHLQHWSQRGFLDFVRGYGQVLEVRTPVPWTQVLLRIGAPR